MSQVTLDNSVHSDAMRVMRNGEVVGYAMQLHKSKKWIACNSDGDRLSAETFLTAEAVAEFVATQS